MVSKEGRAVRLSKEAVEKLERLRNTPMGKVPIGDCASYIIMQFEEEES